MADSPIVRLSKRMHSLSTSPGLASIDCTHSSFTYSCVHILLSLDKHVISTQAPAVIWVILHTTPLRASSMLTALVNVLQWS